MATSNWKKEYSTTHLRKQGAKKYRIICEDENSRFNGQHFGTIFTKNIHESILKTRYNIAKIKIIDEDGNLIILKTNR